MEGAGVDAVEKKDEGDGSGSDEGEEASAVAMMEEVSSFEAGGRLVVGERPGVEEAIGGVEHPNGDEHGGGLDPGERDAGAEGDEEGP